jgi:predicted small integral membrane protein
MTLRIAKILLVAALAFFYTLVVFNNTTDYQSNYQLVHHVLVMDTTLPGNHGMWRALRTPQAWTIFYDCIIAWEAAAMALTWIGAIQLARTLRRPASVFNSAKRLSIVALTLGMLLWFVAFLCIGGEWFLMWQSKLWNGEEAAFRMFAVSGIVLILLALPDTETQS